MRRTRKGALFGPPVCVGRLCQEGEVVLRLAARPRGVLAGEPGAAVLRVRARRKNGGIRLLVDDERLFYKLDNEFRSILFELIKPRHGIDLLLYTAQEKKTGIQGLAAWATRTPSWTGSCTTLSSSTWQRPTCNSVARRTASNTTTPGRLPAPVPTRNNGSAAS